MNDATSEGTSAAPRTLTLTLFPSGHVYELWRVPGWRYTGPLRVATPWGPTVWAYPGTWVLWAPKAQQIVALAQHFNTLQQLGVVR